MSYQAPLADILHVLHHIAADDGTAPPEVADGTAESVVTEAARFAADVLLPLDKTGDREGIRLTDGAITTAPGWPNAYRRWIEGGWNGLNAPSAFGGQALGHLLQAAAAEIWSGANLSFALCPLLNASAIEALAAHASPELQALYLPKLVSGEWTGTMNLTEPQAGSDLGTLRTRAERTPDGLFRITGQKIYISYGEHDLAENIIHLVLARLPDAAAGTRGISLFIVPKFLVEPDGTLGARNDVRCIGIERKLGMHAAPTCTMAFGQKDGAVAYLVGAEGRGLNAMFTMMNQARLAVGLEGVGAAERATQQGIAFARQRVQGRPAGSAEPVPIIRHPDVARMCMTMRALTAAARALCYRTASALDEAKAKVGEASQRAALLTPIAKAFSTDIADEVASLNIQIHGGMGYIEESGAAQIARDIRITSIYEGTNGIQAIDLVTRKLGLDKGAAMAREIASARATLDALQGRTDFGNSAQRLKEALDALERATAFLHMNADAALPGACSYLTLCGLSFGAAALAKGALSSGSEKARGLCRFFCEQLLSATQGLSTAVIDGADDASRWSDMLSVA